MVIGVGMPTLSSATGVRRRAPPERQNSARHVARPSALTVDVVGPHLYVDSRGGHVVKLDDTGPAQNGQVLKRGRR